VKINLTTGKYIATRFTILLGGNQIVYDLVMGSSYSDFYYVGKALKLTDGSITKTFTNSQGLIMKSDTSNADLNCMNDATGFVLAATLDLGTDLDFVWADPSA